MSRIRGPVVPWNARRPLYMRLRGFRRRRAARIIQRRWRARRAYNGDLRVRGVIRPGGGKRRAFRRMEPKSKEFMLWDLNEVWDPNTTPPTTNINQQISWDQLIYYNVQQLVLNRSSSSATDFNRPERAYVDISAVKIQMNVKNVQNEVCILHTALLSPKYENALSAAETASYFFADNTRRAEEYQALNFASSTLTSNCAWKNLTPINSKRWTIFSHKKYILNTVSATGAGTNASLYLSSKRGNQHYGILKEYIPLCRRFYRQNSNLTSGYIPLVYVYWFSPVDVQESATAITKYCVVTPMISVFMKP